MDVLAKLTVEQQSELVPRASVTDSRMRLQVVGEAVGDHELPLGMHIEHAEIQFGVLGASAGLEIIDELERIQGVVHLLEQLVHSEFLLEDDIYLTEVLRILDWSSGHLAFSDTGRDLAALLNEELLLDGPDVFRLEGMVATCGISVLFHYPGGCCDVV
jgi:hypothetical protein